MNFLMIIAWIGAVISTIFFILCTYMTITYPGSPEEMFDKIQGKKSEWPIGKWFIIAIICWAFIFSVK